MQKRGSISNIEIIPKSWTPVQVASLSDSENRTNPHQLWSSWKFNPEMYMDFCLAGESFFLSFSFYRTHTTLLQKQLNSITIKGNHNVTFKFSEHFGHFASKYSVPSFNVLIGEPTGFAFAFTFCPSAARNLTVTNRQMGYQTNTLK